MRLLYISLLLMALFLPVGCGNNPSIIKATQTSAESSPQKQAIHASPSPETELYESALRNAESVYQIGQVELAAAKFDSLLVTNPQKSEPYFYLALIDIAHDHWAAAKERLYAALDRAPADSKLRSSIYANLGLVWECLGNRGQAKLNYTMAVNLNPISDIARSGLERLE